MREISLRLINAYAPNIDNPSFFHKIANFIEQSPEIYTLLCGDLNLVTDPKTDSQNYVNLNHPRSRTALLEILEKNMLVDIYRQLNPNTKRFTWRRKNPLKQARLDYFIGSNSLMDIVHSCNIVPGYRSDHSRLNIEILLDSFEKGTGVWRFNCSLLNNSNYNKEIKKWINEIKQQYAVPIYQINKLDEIEDKEIQFRISDGLLLEMLLLHIRGNTIKFSSKLKKSNNQREISLAKEIEILESEESSNNNDILEAKKDELQHLRNLKLEGYMIRSRTQYIQFNEKPSKFFCNLEKSRYIDKTIKKLTLSNGTIITNQKEILSHTRKLYADLFSNKDNTVENEINLERLIKDKKLNAKEAESLNGPITITELNEAIKNMKSNKTPGIDGFPIEFFKKFWEECKYFILRALNESYKTGMLPQTLRRTVICCLPKGKKPCDDFRNWRPISVASVLYKMATSALAIRLRKIIPKLIST